MSQRMSKEELGSTPLDWDFSDSINDERRPLINAQKSALELEVLYIDLLAQMGEFANYRKKHKNRDLTNTATLHSCDCKSFQYRGSSPKTTFEPCMHIYRLAMELELLFPKHYKSAKSRYVPLTTEEREERKHARNVELLRLREITRDSKAWGEWSRELHVSGQQQDRIGRAKDILEKESRTVQKVGDSWAVNGYGCALYGCDCDDFDRRRLPCKHMYAVALRLGCTIDILETAV